MFAQMVNFWKLLALLISWKLMCCFVVLGNFEIVDIYSVKNFVYSKIILKFAIVCFGTRAGIAFRQNYLPVASRITVCPNFNHVI